MALQQRSSGCRTTRAACLSGLGSGQRKRRPMRPGAQKSGTRQAYLARRRSFTGLGSEFFRHPFFGACQRSGWVGKFIVV